MVALQTMTDITRQLTETNNRVSTGYRIADASDSAAYWAIATTTRSDNGALSTVRDAIAMGAATMDVTYNGLEAVRDSLQEMKELLVASRQPGVDRAAIQEQIEGLQDDIRNKAQASVINEQNYIYYTSGAGFNATRSIVASFERTGDNITVRTIDLDIGDITLFDGNGTEDGILETVRGTHAGGATHSVLTLDIGTVSDAVAHDVTLVNDLIAGVDEAITEVITAQNQVGTIQSRAESQMNFISALIDANDRAVGALVDANMEVESTKLRALQTQQQLAVQSLSIANTSANNILALFR
jgi:flagellin